MDSEARIGLVPTMGNLHAGHLQLMAASIERCDLTVASIFVNPLQFGPQEDLEGYPRTFADDRAQLEAAGVDVLFAPRNVDLYPDGQAAQTTVSVPGISRELCGASRPGHFDGVTTVVLKLFNIVRPDMAFFGRKDYQQLTIISTMLERRAAQRLEAAGFEPDYIAIRDAWSLAVPERQAQSLVILAAARLGQARLIDNLLVESTEPR